MENINTFTKNDKVVKALKMLFKNENINVFIKKYKEGFLYDHTGLKGFSFEYELHEKFDDTIICKSLYAYEFANNDTVEDIFKTLLEDYNDDNVLWYNY